MKWKSRRGFGPELEVKGGDGRKTLLEVEQERRRESDRRISRGRSPALNRLGRRWRGTSGAFRKQEECGEKKRQWGERSVIYGNSHGPEGTQKTAR